MRWIGWFRRKGSATSVKPGMMQGMMQGMMKLDGSPTTMIAGREWVGLRHVLPSDMEPAPVVYRTPEQDAAL